MTQSPIFSIIICLYIPNKRFYSDLKNYLNLKFKNYEIILVTEKNTKIKDTPLSVRIIKSTKSRISLGEKRDLGIRSAKGKFCAFIDDDAYPNPDWLSNALKFFNSNEKIGAVGGPNITPPEDKFWEKVGGFIYESYFTSGRAQSRFLPKKRKYVLELQGVNLIIRREILDKLGGFRSKLYSGDDSKVCSNIRALGYKILYSPEVMVYHHRRVFPIAHLKQVRNMGKHRGFFVKAYPETLALIYFLPLLLIAGFFTGLILSFFNLYFRIAFLALLIFFLTIGYLSVVKRSGFFTAFFVSIGIILTHIVYGIAFLKGLFVKHLER